MLLLYYYFDVMLLFFEKKVTKKTKIMCVREWSAYACANDTAKHPSYIYLCHLAILIALRFVLNIIFPCVLFLSAMPDRT